VQPHDEVAQAHLIGLGEILLGVFRERSIIGRVIGGVEIDEIAFLDLRLKVLKVAATDVGVLVHPVAGQDIVALIDVRPGV
jgi:hypothetical protein